MIFGCDPASKKIALFGVDGAITVAHALKTKAAVRYGELADLRRQLESVIENYPDVTIFCEEPVVAGMRNLRSTILIAETVGMILACAPRVYLVPVSSWKKATTGAGNADKARVSQWLSAEHPAYSSLCGDDQDLRDAAAINLYGQQILGFHRLRPDDGGPA